MIFDADFHKVKLIDFGMTRKCGTYVRRLIGSIPYSPPEVCDAFNTEILVTATMDVWAFGVLLFCCLTGESEIGCLSENIFCIHSYTGNFPWEHAQETDAYFNEYLQWHRRQQQTQRRCKLPSQWYRFSGRLMRLFKKMLGSIS